MSQYWSWALAIVGLTGMWLAGQHNKWGWAVSLCAQFIWITYALVTWQLGFVVSAIAYGSIYVRNFIKWRKLEYRKKEEENATHQAV